MDFDNIKERILEFLKRENKSSAHFAQEIGVQPSAISHIISGRNKPSLDFIMKMINRYPALSVEWLLFGKGSMYPDKMHDELFSEDPESKNGDKDLLSSAGHNDTFTMESIDNEKTENKSPATAKLMKNRKKAARIIVFYDDNTFTEHFPGGE